METKNGSPRISVIIPTYNRAVLLESSLRSLAKQSIPKKQYEVVVIDDGSTDNTKDVCSRFDGDLRMRYFHQKNSGISAAKNLGIFVSNAPLLLFFDDDDVADQNLLKEHLMIHNIKPQEHIAVLGYTGWAPHLNVTELMKYITGAGQFLFSYQDLHNGQILDFRYFWGGRTSCKRSLLVKHGIFNQEFRFGCEDIELGYRLSKFNLSVIYNSKAISHMNRVVTYEEFCRRCEKQGRSQYIFSRMYPDGIIQQYCGVMKAEEKWRFIETTLEKNQQKAHKLESLLAQAQDSKAADAVLEELHNLYWWSFHAFKIKGIVGEMKSGTSGDDMKSGTANVPVIMPEKDREYLRNKWPHGTGSRLDRKNVLVIDPFLPMFDMASGSLRLFHILKILSGKGYKVTFIARYGRHAERYVPLLQDMGIEVYDSDPSAMEASGVYVIGPYLDLEKILTERFYDTVVLDFWSLAEYYLPLVRQYSPSSRIIVDSVDIHFLREIREAELEKDDLKKAAALKRKKRELDVYRKADRLWVITPEDRRAVEDLIDDLPIDIMPNVHEKVESGKTFMNTSDLLFVGNFNHPPNRDAVLYFCRDIFPAILSSLKDAKFYIVGNNPPEEIRELESDNIIVTGYVEDIRPYLQKARISVCPLRYGAGMKGKVGEALSWGLPVVATSIGAEGMGLVDGRDLLIADTSQTFAEQVVRVYNDAELWRSLSENGRRLVEQQWSPEAMTEKLGNVFHFDAPDNGKVSIIILTFNQLEYTKQCVESIRKCTPEPHEIIFVDNGSTDGTVKWLKQLLRENDHYRLIENKRNLGFSKGCNQGMQVSNGQYILLLNNDVVVTGGWLSGMLECLESSPETGIIGPMTNNISGIQKDIFADYQSVDHLDVYAKGFRERNRHRRIPVRRVVGFCMLFRRGLVEKIGMLDERFGSGNFEDDDYCLRAALEGFRNHIAGDVFIHHYGNRSFIGNRIDYYDAMARNRKLFNKKWNGIDAGSPLGKKLIGLKALEKADTLYQKGMIQEAVEAYLKGIKHAPGETALYYALSEMLIDEKRFKDAGDALKEIPDQEKSLKRTALLGYCNEGMELSDEAERCADEVLSLDMKNAPALNLKGILAYRKGRIDEAEKFFAEAVACDPSFGEPYTNLGVLKWSAGSADEALCFSEKGFVLSPTLQDMLTIYHSIASAQGEFERMEWRLREAKSLHPLHRRLAFFLIDVLIRQGRNDEAMREIQEAMISFGTDDGMISAAIEIRKRIDQEKAEALNGSDKRPEKGKVSLCMIVKNEEKYLPGCLKSAAPLADEIIVIDTGSTDRTKDIAWVFGAAVHDFEWTGDFSAARNVSLEIASGDWILVLDADEVIAPEDHAALRKLVQKKEGRPVAYSFVTRNYVKEMTVTGWTANTGRYREEAGSGWFPGEKVRLFPNDRRIRFENPVHELVEPSLKKAGIKTKDCGVPIHHYGKLGSDKVLSKGEDYCLIGRKKLDEKTGDIKALFELAVQTTELHQYDKAVDLWKSVIHFSGKVPYEMLARAYLNLGGAYLELGSYDEAIASSRKALELAPDLKGAVINYGLAELCAGDIGNTVRILEDLLARDDYPPAKTMLAAAYSISGKKDKGLEYLQELKGAGFNAGGYLYHYAKNLVAAGRGREGMMLLEAAVESGNVNRDILSLLADCYRNADISQTVQQPA